MEPPKKLIKMSEGNQPIASNAGSDVNIAPAQDSPKNIVNILNDDCIQAVLRKLDNAMDFFNAANVCTQFQDNAKTCYQHKHIEFRHYVPGYLSKKQANNVVLFKLAESFLKLFVTKIKSVYCGEWLETLISKTEYNHYNNLISKYCAKTLVELQIDIKITHGTNLNIELPFSSLQKLTLRSCSISNRCTEPIFPELTHLTLLYPSDASADWLKNHFPKLEQVVHRDWNCDMINEELLAFQSLNPQIRNYQTYYTYYELSLWQGIANRLPNIETLRCKFKMEEMEDISKLRLLKDLDLYSQFDLQPIKSLFSSFIKNNQPIQKLKLREIDFELLVLLQKLNTIKKLTVEYNTSKGLALGIVRMLPTLEYLIIRNVRMSTVAEMVQNASSTLRKLVVEVNQRKDFDLNAYNSIVALATDRMKVTIRIHVDFEDSIKKIGRINSDWVTISYYKMVENIT